MWKRIVLGAIAGATATIPQSAVVWGLRRAGFYRHRPPPEVVSEQVTDPIVDVPRLPRAARWTIKLAEHFGYGAAGGALFALLTALVRPALFAGVLAGLAIWKASYDGWIPALGILPPPDRDERGRTATMLLAHVAYGAALGLTLDRSADRH